MGTNTLRKPLAAVQLVALRGELTVREIAEAMKLPKSTAHRLVASLVDVRLLQSERGADGDVYTVGPLVGELNGGQLAWRAIWQHARPEMAALRDEIGETVGLHVLHAERRVLVGQEVSAQSHRWVYNNHMVPMPMYGGAASKMLLALLPEDDRRRLAERDHLAMPRTGRKTAGLAQFLAELQRIRDQHYSTSSDEVNPGITSIAVPVVTETHRGHPLAVITVAGPSVRFTEQVMKRCLPRLRLAARRIAEQLSEGAGGTARPVRAVVNGRARTAIAPAVRDLEEPRARTTAERPPDERRARNAAATPIRRSA